MWERKKITSKDNQLIALENMIRGIKKDKELFEEKLDIINDEIKENEKLA